MKIAEIDARLVRQVALELLKANPDGVRTTEVANEARVAAVHHELIEENATTYKSLVGKVLANFARLQAIKDAPGAAQDMLWRAAS